MALKTFKPYTKSTRGTILVDRTGLWKGKPFKSLVSPKNAMKGRNNNGHITSINRAGGHKKMYRHVDFYRKKFDMEATVERIEYDPNRSCYIMLVKFEDGEKFYYLAPEVESIYVLEIVAINLKLIILKFLEYSFSHLDSLN